MSRHNGSEVESVQDDTDEQSVAGRYTLFIAVLKRKARLTLRYRVNFLIEIVGIYLFFAGAFFGGQVAIERAGNGIALEPGFDGVIVGFFLWTAAQVSYSGLQRSVTTESQWGTLEQLFISPYGFQTVMTTKLLVNVIWSIFVAALLLLLMMVTTTRGLTIDAFTIVPILLLTLLSVLGVGFVIAGLAMIYKKVGNINNIMQIILLGLVATPAVSVSGVSLLPLAHGSAMLQDAMRQGISLFEFSIVDLGLLLGVGFGYLAVGYALFGYATRVARRRGVMGHY